MIHIAKKFINQIIGHSKREFPNEACGILSGSAGKVGNVYEMANTDKSPHTFFMDAQEQLRVVKEIRIKGEEMIGIYHSHVASIAYPSTHDVELALYPEVSYVIVSIRDKFNPAARSFKIAEGEITEEEIRVE